MPADPTRSLSKNKKALLVGLRSLGAGLLFASAGEHLHLYFQTYKFIPTIDNLFLIQFAVAILLGVAVLVFPTRWVAIAGAGFAAGTVVVYEIFRVTTVFGFHEVRTDAGFVSGLLEALAAGALAAYAALLPRTEKEETGPTALASAIKLIASPFSLGVATIGAAALIVILGLTALPKTTSTPPATSQSSVPSGNGPTASIVIQNFAFSPASITVTPGETVSVTNKDAASHTVTSDTGAFDTGLVGTNQTVTFKAPSKPGSYPYHCTVHTFMKGMLVVS